MNRIAKAINKNRKTTAKMKASSIHLKETRNSYFCLTPNNHRLMFVS